VLAADLVIGAVLKPGAAAPRLVTREVARRMRPGAVLVDISIDQGGVLRPHDRRLTPLRPTSMKASFTIA
jgi:alanine dehydrogenase